MKKVSISIPCIFFGGILIELLVSPIRGWISFQSAGIIAFFLYVTYTFWCLTRIQKVSSKLILILVFSGWGIKNLPIRILFWKETLISLPEITMHILGMATGYLLYKNCQKRRIVVLIISIFTCIFFASYYNKWIHKLNFDTFSGKTEEIIKQPLIFENIEGNNVSVTDLKKQYVVLDFWSSTCNVCIKEFPNVQKVYDRYKGNSHIKVYSVFCKISSKQETILSGLNILEKHNISLPILAISIKDPILKEIGVNSFPTIIIFDPTGKIVFRGDIESADKYLSELIN